MDYGTYFNKKKNRDLLCKQKDDMDSKDYPYTPLTRAKSPYEGRKVSDGIV